MNVPQIDDVQIQSWEEFFSINSKLTELVAQCQEQGDLKRAVEYQELLHQRLLKAGVFIETGKLKSLVQNSLSDLQTKIPKKKRRNTGTAQTMGMALAMQYCMMFTQAQIISNIQNSKEQGQSNIRAENDFRTQQTHEFVPMGGPDAVLHPSENYENSLSQTKLYKPVSENCSQPPSETSNRACGFGSPSSLSTPLLDKLMAQLTNLCPDIEFEGSNLLGRGNGNGSISGSASFDNMVPENSCALPYAQTSGPIGINLSQDFQDCKDDEEAPKDVMSQISLLLDHDYEDMSKRLFRSASNESNTLAEAPSSHYKQEPFAVPPNQINPCQSVSFSSTQQFNPLMLLATSSPPPLSFSSKRNRSQSHELQQSQPDFSNTIPVQPNHQNSLENVQLPFDSCIFPSQPNLPTTEKNTDFRVPYNLRKICAECKRLHRTTKDCRERHKHTTPEWDVDLPPQHERRRIRLPVGFDFNPSPWSAEEDRHLVELEQLYGRRETRNISLAMGGLRTVAQIETRLKELDEIRGVWTKEDEYLLDKLVKTFGRHATRTIHKKLGGRKTFAQVVQRLSQYQDKKKASQVDKTVPFSVFTAGGPFFDLSIFKTGPWTHDEESVLIKCIDIFGKDDLDSIVRHHQAQQTTGIRSVYQIKTKIEEISARKPTKVNPQPNVGAWSALEVQLLSQGLELFGRDDFEAISNYMQQKRTVFQIRNKIAEMQATQDNEIPCLNIPDDYPSEKYCLGPWSKEELQTLFDGIELYGFDSESAEKISRMNGLQGKRTLHQVRTQLQQMCSEGAQVPVTSHFSHKAAPGC